uniref:Uncharacterized protein LOC102801497 n=1 Tax=Saccoglossus kowalevskii TaxID=10224 RepID=A0ABM0LTS2_SACKO|nr:PREDICTED: uncharacterized protein LOC102801497 [Saccoglossus kowalevskii]
MVGTIYLEMERLTESRKYLVEALELEERLWRSGKPHSYDWGHLKTRLEEVALLLDLPDTVIYSYKRRFEAAEDKKNFGKPAPRKDFRDKNESSSESSDDDDIPSVDISELVHSNDDLTSLLCSKHWDVTETGVFDPTQYIMIGSYCWLVVIAIGVAMYYMLYSGSQ